jgi:hypothetical protein
MAEKRRPNSADLWHFVGDCVVRQGRPNVISR